MVASPVVRRLAWLAVALAPWGCAREAPLVASPRVDEPLPPPPEPDAPAPEPEAAPAPPAAAPAPEVTLERVPRGNAPVRAPSVTILEPRAQQSIDADVAGRFSVRLRLADWKSELGGQRVHVGLDGGPYRPFYDLDDIELRDLVSDDVAPGDHVLVAFAVAEDGTAVKAKSALAVTHFWVGPKGTPKLAPGAPLLIHHLPSGSYGGAETKAVPVDFLLHNAELGAGKHRVVVHTAGQGSGRPVAGTIEDDGAYMLGNLGDGERRVTLELQAPAGTVVASGKEQRISLKGAGPAAEPPTELEKRISKAKVDARRCLVKARYRSGILVVPKDVHGKNEVAFGWADGLKPKESLLACVKKHFAPLAPDLRDTIVQVGRMNVPGEPWGKDEAGKTKVRTKKGKVVSGRIEGKLVYRSDAMPADGKFVAVWLIAPGDGVSRVEPRSVQLNGSKELTMCVVKAPTKELVEKGDDAISICDLAGPLMGPDEVLTMKDGRAFDYRRGQAVPKDGPNTARVTIVGSFRGPMGRQEIKPDVELVDGARTVTLVVGKDL